MKHDIAHAYPHKESILWLDYFDSIFSLPNVILLNLTSSVKMTTVLEIAQMQLNSPAVSELLSQHCNCILTIAEQMHVVSVKYIIYPAMIRMLYIQCEACCAEREMTT